MRTGYDSTSASAVPAGGDIYLGYVDGNYRSYPGMVARFPGKLVVPISVDPSSNAGLVFDGPPDNATWPGVVGWVVRRRSHGVDPTVYTDLSSWPTAMAAFRAANVAYPHWWIAHYDGIAVVLDGTVGKQYNSVANRFDTSAFADYWPGVDPAPPTGGPAPTTPPATAMEDDEMALILAVTPDPSVAGATTGTGLYLMSGALVAHLTSTNDVTALQAAGVKQAAIAAATFQNILAAGSSLSGSLSGSLSVSGNLNVGS